MGDKHNVFISWSGSRSKAAAKALHNWIPSVIQAAKPWMSDTDIEAGSRGLNDISDNLQGMKVAVVCLTPENLAAPWILYECGALSKTIDTKTRLCPYLLGGLRPEDIKGPLAMFQGTNSDKPGTHRMVASINAALSDEPLSEPRLNIAFDKYWPDLEAALNEMPKGSEPTAPKRTTEDMVSEILNSVRGQADGLKSIQDQLVRVGQIVQLARLGHVALTPSGYVGGTIYSDPNTESMIFLQGDKYSLERPPATPLNKPTPKHPGKK
ncbi:MAG TPA: hypothetical protein VGR94_08405 [Candidatus Acidoferrales bacterium]|nr:hypothetical protein [Candidatus Acidoferrales bacterium]